MIEQLIVNLIEREGGFVNHPADRGGPTNMGITQKTLSRWRKRVVTVKDVQALTRDEAEDIYWSEYWEGPKFNTLNIHPVIAEMLFDAGVHHGPNRSARLLQTAIGGLKVDGLEWQDFSGLTCKLLRVQSNPRLRWES